MCISVIVMCASSFLFSFLPSIQMFPFHRVTEKKSVKVKLQLFSVCPPKQTKPTKSRISKLYLQLSNKAASLRWKRVTQNAGLVVKDVICLPSGYLAQLDR